MYGWRARLGYIYGPEAIEVPLYEFYRMAPTGVTMVVSLLGIRSLQNEELDRGFAMYEEKAMALSRRKVDLMVVSGTPVILHQGYGAEQRLSRYLEEKTGTRTITTLEAAIEALRRFQARKVGIVSSLGKERVEDLMAYLDQAGFTSTHIKGAETGLELSGIAEMSKFESYQQVKRGLSGRDSGVDTVFVPSVSFPCPFVRLLEQELGITVVTANTAALWMALRELRVALTDGDADMHGRLMQSLVRHQ